jgi:ATP-dependent Clp protease protease subunit
MTDTATPPTVPPKDERLIAAEVLKAEAEVRKLDLESANLALEASKLRAEAANIRAQARHSRAYAIITEFTAADRAEDDAQARAHDLNNAVYTFDTEVDDRSVKYAMSKLSEWARRDPGCAIELRFNSPGGDVIAGMALFDFLQSLRRQGHTIITVAYGMAASIAGILLQAGDIRVMGQESYLLIHQVRSGIRGSFGEIEDEVAFLSKMQDRILDIFAARSTMTREEIKKQWERRDWWLDSAEALAAGFVDEVR